MQLKILKCGSSLLSKVFLVYSVLHGASLFGQRQHVFADEGSSKLKRYETAVDRAVDRGLYFLARRQATSLAQDGSFDGKYGQTNGVVSLAAMAFLAKGYRPGVGPYGDVINKLVDYVLATPTKNGYLGVRGGDMYSHGIATLLLSEVSGMVDERRQAQIDEMLPKALRLIIDAHNAPKKRREEFDGWRYKPDSNDSDLSLTGWQLMALRSARLSGAPVPEDNINRAMKFVRQNYRDDGPFFGLPDGMGGFVYTNSHHIPHHSTYVEVINKQPSVGMTGVGMTCLELGGAHDSEETRKSGNFILKMTQGKDLIDDPHYREYAIYYCAQGMFQLGGNYWEQYAERMYVYLLREQNLDGSWTIQGYSDAYPTAMYLLSLSIAYRQLPIYQR